MDQNSRAASHPERDRHNSTTTAERATNRAGVYFLSPVVEGA
ncbi:hypothetical protein OKW42_005245 [Paraburkholderia sp. WC7.3d]